MSLFNRAARRSPTASSAAIERYLGSVRAELEPDPLYRRRMRSNVVNRFVATREGIGTARGGMLHRRMGRLGRACLYAAFTLGASAASVLAASQEALPGEALYSLKQRIEQLRLEVVPSELRSELEAYALGERIEEMGRLVESGRAGLAVAMAPGIEREYERLAALGGTVDADAVRIQRHVQVLARLIERLPAPARSAVERAMDRPRPQAQPQGPGAGPARAGGIRGAGGGPFETARPAPTARPEQTAKPSATAKPERTVRPDRGTREPLEGAG